jgi:radical SAM superfamily enzyme YgiQ (UPF0313 family)
MAGMTRAVLVSTYDLGHQPFGLASPAAWLRREGLIVDCFDLSKQKLDDAAIAQADLIAFHLPMHTATRMAAPVIERCRLRAPAARLCAYGLYAPLNEAWLRSLGVHDVLGAEFEAALADVARAVGGGAASPAPRPAVVPATSLPKLHFITPDRRGLPALSQYAVLQLPDGSRRTSGYTEASRGCRHLCRHCPVVPVYDGQFRIVQHDVVLDDIARQVDAGAAHITFGDPDFLNGPTHALRIVQELHRRFPTLTYDATIKVEHLLKHRDMLPEFVATGCLFVTSAVESIDDRVLARLDKGHTRRDFETTVTLCRAAGLPLVPTFVAFHPWMSLEDYCDLLQALVALDLVDHVAPIQLAIRLLVPSGSRLLDLPEMQAVITGFDPKTLTHRWAHPDPRVDALQAEISALVGRRLMSHRRELFQTITALAHERAGRPAPAPIALVASSPVPHSNEPWYCCAEPNPEQLTLV